MQVWERSRFVMVSDNYFAAEAVYHCRIGANSKCRGGKDKRQMDLSLLFLHRQGLAGRPSDEDQPDLPVAGLQSALGSLPSVALSSAEANGLVSEFNRVEEECFPFPFP